MEGFLRVQVIIIIIYITIFNTSSWNETATLVGHEPNIGDPSWSPEGDRIASCSDDGTARVWDISTGEELWNYTHNDPVAGVCWSSDGRRVVSGSTDGEIKVVNASDGAVLFNFTGPTDRGLQCIRLSPDSTKIATGWGELFQEDIIIWSANNGTKLLNFTGDNSFLSSIDWSPDSSMIVAGFWDDKVKIFRASDGMELMAYNFPPFNYWFQKVEWFSDGVRIAAQTRGAVIILSVDPDNDGFFYDDFPFDPAASLDSDSDNYPDEWNPGMGPENSTSNLTKLDDFPYNATQWNDTDNDGWGDNYANTTWPNEREWPVGAQHIPNAYRPDRFPLKATQWNDTDGDGGGDNYANISWGQNRSIGIYIPNAYKPDRYPLDPTRWNDTDGNNEPSDFDGDGIPDYLDPDIDGDGWNNTIEMEIGTDVWDNTSYPSDLDSDGIPDVLDLDIDNDGWNNTIEIEVGTDPYDSQSFPSDLDRDGIPDILDPDIDGDGWNNTIEIEVGTDPYDNQSFPTDLDNDRIPDLIDLDIDGDGWNNTIELEIGTDPYDNQSFPSDIDRDGIPDLIDLDIDGDGWNNTIELEVRTDPYDKQSFPSDLDNDTIPDILDPDIDGDGWNNTIELEEGTDPYDPLSYPQEGADDDDPPPPDGEKDSDGDGYNDTYENASGSDPYDKKSTPLDRDGDGVLNVEDAYPDDPDRWEDEINVLIVIICIGVGLIVLLAGVNAYIRIRTKEQVLANKTRGAILNYIDEHPGTHQREIRKQFKMGGGAVSGHLRKMERVGLLRSNREGFYKCYYTDGFVTDKRNITPMQKKLIKILAKRQGATYNELGKELGITREGVLYHMKDLEDKELVRSEERENSLFWYLDEPHSFGTGETEETS